MKANTAPDLTERIDRACTPLHGHAEDYDDLLDAVGERAIVLIGAATHGTHEFYRERALITQRLITECGFNAVAIEGDWPDAYRVHRFVTGHSDDTSAEQSLRDFRHFPAWMWRNTDVAAFVDWLRQHNSTIADRHRVGFFGLDLYSLHASINAVLEYLEQHDPAAAARARERYACFDRAGCTVNGERSSCEQQVVDQLIDLRRHAATYVAGRGWVGRDEFFMARQNARLVRDAEEYYRTLLQARGPSWNLRELHMAETVQALMLHQALDQRPAKLVVWEHNSHVGDARATGLGAHGEVNLGQLVRQQFGADQVLLIGFTSYAGKVTAATDWGGRSREVRLPRALAGSIEDVFHGVGHARFSLRLRADAPLNDQLRQPRLHRAVGVIYPPVADVLDHYLDTRLTDQFDVVVHIDRTRALTPLDSSPASDHPDGPDTYPFGL